MSSPENKKEDRPMTFRRALREPEFWLLAWNQHSCHVWTAHPKQGQSWHAMIAVECSYVSGLFVLPSSRLLALMWFARQVLITRLGLTPVTRRRFSRLDDRPTDQHHAMSTPATS